MTKLKDIPIEDILAAVGDDHYRQAQARELTRLEDTLASLAVQYDYVQKDPVTTEEERGATLARLEGQLRGVHWVISHLKDRQRAVSEALHGSAAVP